MAISQFNEFHCRAFLAHLFHAAQAADGGVGGCIEVRIFAATWSRNNYIEKGQRFSRTFVGWYDDPDKLIVDARKLKGVSGYIIPNPASRDLLARADNRLIQAERGGATNDDLIVSLEWLFIDLDCDRLVDISATDEERAAALERRDLILADHPDFRRCGLVGSSGNGGFILVKLPSYPNDDHHRGLVKRAIEIIHHRYTDDRIKGDTKTKNPSRLMALVGTLKCKGSERPERPWRLADLVEPIPAVGSLPALDLEGWLAAQPVIAMTATTATTDQPSRPTGAVSNGRADHPEATIQKAAEGPQEAPGAAGRAERAFRLYRAERYVNGPTFAGSISGQGGHDQAFDAACALVKGFDLTIGEARPILGRWNAKCQPPWSDRELEHKLDQADKKADDKPRGYKWKEEDDGNPDRPTILNGHIAGPDDAGCIPGLEDNRHRLARLIVARKFTHPDGLTLRYWREEFHEWDGASYQPIPRKEVTAQVTRELAAEFDRIYQRDLILHGIKKNKAKQEGDGGKGDGAGKGIAKKESMPHPIPVTTRIVADVTQALTDLSLLKVAKCPTQPAWLDGRAPYERPADEILPARNVLVHLPSLIEGKPCTQSTTPTFFASCSLGYDFNPDASKPNAWLNFLDQLWPGDKESITTLQEWMGHLLTPDTSQQKILMLIGPKRSGKGTIARVIRAMIGPSNVVNPTLSSLATNFGLAPLIGKPAAIITDARISGRTDTAVVIERLLSISGEDCQTMDRKHREVVTAKLPTRFMLVSNELPRMKDASGALVGRMIFLQLTQSFFGREDTRLIDRILPELPGILRWSIAGWARLRRRGRFVQPRSADELHMAMETLSSPIKTFLKERCKAEPGQHESIQNLFLQWKFWCMSKGQEYIGNDEEFGRNLRAVLPKLEKFRPYIDGVRTNAYKGLRLLTEDELAESGPDAEPGDAAEPSDSDGEGASGQQLHRENLWFEHDDSVPF